MYPKIKLINGPNPKTINVSLDNLVIFQKPGKILSTTNENIAWIRTAGDLKDRAIFLDTSFGRPVIVTDDSGDICLIFIKK